MTNELPKKTYLVTETLRTFEVKANSEEDALLLVRRHGRLPICPQCEYQYALCKCVVEFEEPDTSAELLSCEGCPECEARPAEWHNEQKVTVTFETLKRNQAEEIFNGLLLAIDYLEDINLHTGANALGELVEVLNKERNLPEWQQPHIVEVVEFVKAWK